MKMYIAIIIILLLLLISFTRYEKITYNGYKWNVLSNFKNKDEAAKLLYDVNDNMINILDYLRKKYKIDSTVSIDQIDKNSVHYKLVDTLLDNYNYEMFYENSPLRPNETSYTVGKGDSMQICLREKNNINKLIDKNDIIFVLLHEAAHIANYINWGHTPEFWRIFKFLLIEAQNSGYYKPIDYHLYPRVYCGIALDYNPLFNNYLSSI